MDKILSLSRVAEYHIVFDVLSNARVPIKYEQCARGAYRSRRKITHILRKQMKPLLFFQRLKSIYRGENDDDNNIATTVEYQFVRISRTGFGGGSGDCGGGRGTSAGRKKINQTNNRYGKRKIFSPTRRKLYRNAHCRRAQRFSVGQRVGSAVRARVSRSSW